MLFAKHIAQSSKAKQNASCQWFRDVGVSVYMRMLFSCLSKHGSKFQLFVLVPLVLLWFGIEHAEGALPRMPQLENIDTDNPVSVFEGLFAMIVRVILVVISVIAVLVVAVRIVVDVNEARRGEATWSKAFATALGGAAVIIFVIYLANFAQGIIS